MEKKLNTKDVPENDSNPSLFKGLVVPSRWDKSGNITGISLSTFDESIYPIDNNDLGKKLLQHIGEGVVIEGTIDPGSLSKEIIVNNFRRFDFS